MNLHYVSRLKKSASQYVHFLLFCIFYVDVTYVIKQLLDVEDVLVAKPDERSVMTYVAHWFHAFSALDKIETAGRRVEKFVEVMSSSIDLQHSYEDRVNRILDEIAGQIKAWQKASFTGTYSDAKQQHIEFSTYKTRTKRNWIAEKTQISSMLGNIKTKLTTYGLRDYSPPRGLGLSDLDGAWKLLLQAEAVRSRRINEAIRDIKEDLRKKFAETANTISEKIEAASIDLISLDGELEEQQKLAKQIEGKLEPAEALLGSLKRLMEKLEEAKVEENDYTVYSYDELEYEFQLAKEAINKKLAFIENQIVARSMTNLTPIQLEEFESVFRYFDKRQQNSLEEVEFAAALASLGLVYSEEDMHEVYDDVREGDPAVSFEQFIRFMVDVTEDQNTAEQVLQSFMEVADGKPYVTEFDLRNSLIPDGMIEQLEGIMPKYESEEGLDYVQFMERLCI